MKRSPQSMLNIAIGHGMGASQVGRYRVADALPTDGAVADTAGVVAGTITGAVAGTPGMDAHPVRRYRVEDARPTD